MPGGIERAIVNTANLLYQNGHKISIIVFDKSSASFYPVLPGIHLINDNLHFGLTKDGNVITRKLLLLYHIKKFRTILSQLKPDIVIGTEYVYSIVTKLAFNGKGIKVIAWEHHHFNWLIKSRFWRYLQSKVYPKLDTVICLNKTESQLFQNIGCKTVVIPNFISPGTKSNLSAKSLLTIGWLIKRKGIDLIPMIAEKIFTKHKDWTWKIIGEGSEYTNLKNSVQAKSLDINVQITKPSSPDLSSVYQNGSIYVMTSRFECFPMVLLEAMSNGLPCIAFNCPTGPADIINHEQDGILIPGQDVEQMSQAIMELINNEEKRKMIGSNAYENIKRFTSDRIYKLWNDLINREVH